MEWFKKSSTIVTQSTDYLFGYNLTTNTETALNSNPNDDNMLL